MEQTKTLHPQQSKTLPPEYLWASPLSNSLDIYQHKFFHPTGMSFYLYIQHAQSFSRSIC